MKSSGVNAVMPGAIRTRSTPAATRIGHSMSASWHAANSRPSETFGAARLAANPSAKWPTNIDALRRFPGFFVEEVQPLLHEGFVEAARLEVLIGEGVRQTRVLGAIVHERAAPVRVEQPLEHEKERRLIVRAFLQEFLEEPDGVDALAERGVNQGQRARESQVGRPARRRLFEDRPRLARGLQPQQRV